MIYNLYAIRDLKGGYLAPFVAQNDAIAVRNISNAIQDERTELSKIYEDCELYNIGQYNTDNGDIITGHNFIVALKDLKIEVIANV